MAAFIRCQGAVRRQIGQQRLRAADSVECVAAVAVEHFRSVGRCDIHVWRRHQSMLVSWVQANLNYFYFAAVVQVAVGVMRVGVV